MATSKSYFTRPSYRFLPSDNKNRDSPPMASDSIFEFDESEIYNNNNNNNSPEFRKPIRIGRKSSTSKISDHGAPSSLPVNIPDWSKILGNEYRENRRRNSIDDGYDESDDGGCGGGRMPPHEFLARTRMASFSVHEGAGRTLKGRDLSRVRNAIWAKTGFED